MKDHAAYLSIGSNRGDKKKNLEDAVEMLRAHEEINVDAVSSMYRTRPQNFADQDWFVNAALKIRTSLEPDDLLSALKTIESQLDKEGKAFRFGPRVIDLDIIFFDDVVHKTPHLELPHPRMHERCFVLVPMCDISPRAIHPIFKKSAEEMLKEIEQQEDQEVFLLDEEE